MSSKTAKYYYRRYNWQEINNLFCYDVVFPERLSQKQQILRLYKNSLRRVFDNEINGVKPNDLHAYAEGCKDVRKDFETLKSAKTAKQVEELVDKYEYFIESTYQTTPVFRDNVAYEWRHSKGLFSYSEDQISYDPWGYYDSKKLDYYPKPREFEFRDEFPFDDTVNSNQFNSNGWDEVSLDDSTLKTQTESPENFKSKVEELKRKYVKQVDVWEGQNKKH